MALPTSWFFTLLLLIASTCKCTNSIDKFFNGVLPEGVILSAPLRHEVVPENRNQVRQEDPELGGNEAEVDEAHPRPELQVLGHHRPKIARHLEGGGVSGGGEDRGVLFTQALTRVWFDVTSIDINTILLQ